MGKTTFYVIFDLYLYNKFLKGNNTLVLVDGEDLISLCYNYDNYQMTLNYKDNVFSLSRLETNKWYNIEIKYEDNSLQVRNILFFSFILIQSSCILYIQEIW